MPAAPRTARSVHRVQHAELHDPFKFSGGPVSTPPSGPPHFWRNAAIVCAVCGALPYILAVAIFAR